MTISTQPTQVVEEIAGNDMEDKPFNSAKKHYKKILLGSLEKLRMLQA